MLEALKAISAIEGISPSDGRRAREEALDLWINYYITDITIENMVIKNILTPSEKDFLTYHIALQIAEKMIEDHAMVSMEGNKIKVKVLVLNKDFPKNKE